MITILTALIILTMFVFISASIAMIAICFRNRQIDRETVIFNELIEEHSIQVY